MLMRVHDTKTRYWRIQFIRRLLAHISRKPEATRADLRASSGMVDFQRSRRQTREKYGPRDNKSVLIQGVTGENFGLWRAIV